MARRLAHEASRASSDPKVEVLFEGTPLPVSRERSVSCETALGESSSTRVWCPAGPRSWDPWPGPESHRNGSPTSIFSHHHPDHTLNAALFPRARFHDFWAIYRNDTWESRAAEGFHVSPHVHLLETPGHTPQDITTIVETPQGAYAFTHLWWDSSGPAEDPLADNAELVHKNRARVVRLAKWVVPGHGAAFLTGPATPP